MRQQPKLTRGNDRGGVPRGARRGASHNNAGGTTTTGRVGAAAVAACEARAILALGERLNAVAETVEIRAVHGFGSGDDFVAGDGGPHEQLVLGAAKRLE